MEGLISQNGELNVAFTVLKALDKIVNNSVLDLSFEEGKVYGAATMCQIKESKQLYRSLEASSKSHIAQKYSNKLL